MCKASFLALFLALLMLDVDVFDTESSNVSIELSSLELSKLFFELFIESQAQSLATNMITNTEQSVFMVANWRRGSQKDKLQLSIISLLCIFMFFLAYARALFVFIQSILAEKA